MCELLDGFQTFVTSIDKLYEIPQSLVAIEPQILKCKFIEDISDDFVEKLATYGKNIHSEPESSIVKIQVERIDKYGFYHLKSINLIHTTQSFTMPVLRTQVLNTMNLPIEDDNQESLTESYDGLKDFGFDFNYPEATIIQSNVVDVGRRNKKPIKSDTYVGKSLTKEQINKTKLQLTSKYTKEAKNRPLGVIVVDSIESNGTKTLSIPRYIGIGCASDHYFRALTKLNLTLDSHFCQLLSFEHVVSGRDLTLVGPVKSGLSTALALGLSFKMHNQILAGYFQNKKLYVIILVRNAASGRYLENFFTAIFSKNTPKFPFLKVVFVDEINYHVKSSADIITANIIIGSIRCVLEAISHQFIVLNDLKCIFVDDAHILLRHSASECQKLFNQIKQIEDPSNLWSMLPSSAKNFEKPDSTSSTECHNIQIISNSHKWTIELKSFQEAFTTKPLTFIIDPIEMISYMSPSPYTPQMGFHSNATSLKSHFISWVTSNIMHGNLLVFTRTALECEMVYELCNSNGVNALRGTGFVDPGKIHDLNTIWCATRNSCLRYVFIVSDCALYKLTISDAFYTYHYTLPYTKADLRNRLGCSLSFYQSIVNNTFNSIQNSNSCNQYVAVCPNYNCSNFIYCYKHFTVSIDKSSIDISVNNFYKSKLYTKEYAMFDQLCPNMKLYGVCPVDKVFCKNSHLPWIINLMDHTIHRGFVQFTVSSVPGCTQFFGIVESFSTGNPFLDKHLNESTSRNRIQLLNDFSFDMQLDSTKENIKFSPTLIQNNCVYACKDQTGTYSRCKLVGECIENDKLLNVYCIDTGLNKIVNKTHIFECPDSFKQIKPLVYEFIFTNYIPADIIYGWPNHLNIQINQALIGKTVSSHIVYGFDNTIWIDSLIQKSKLDNVETKIVNFSLGHFLKNATCARASNQLIKYVLQLSCSTYQYKRKSSGHFKNLIGSTIDICKVEQSLRQACVCELSSSHFHINHCDSNDIKNNIENLIHEITADYESHPPSFQHYRINDLCLAKFPDNMWYRARITHFNEPQNPNLECSYNVFMIDIGEVCNNLYLDHLIPVRNTHSLISIPGLAIRCSMVDADFSGLNDDELDAVFDYLDKLGDNLYVMYQCDGSHSKSVDSITEITHQIQCYSIADIENHSQCSDEEPQFCNVLVDLFLGFHVKPSDSMNQMLYEHFGYANNSDTKKFTYDEWVTFIARAKNESSISERLKSLLNRRLPSV